MIPSLGAASAQWLHKRWLGGAVQHYVARPFGRQTRLRVLLCHDPNTISFAQAFPFLYHAPELQKRFGAGIRLALIDRESGNPSRMMPADLILYQPWFTLDGRALAKSLEELRTANPTARIVFVDSYAQSDLRLARYLPDDLWAYLKKSLFVERAEYLVPRSGDTNLTEYYGRLHGISAEPVDWQTPHRVLDRLHLSPNFLTAPQFLRAFTKGRRPDFRGRAHDLHARLGHRGGPWYAAMRGAALDAANGLEGLSVLSAGIVPRARYLAELQASRLCFSPFGYGEICWRDIEAIQAGAVLIKPDMGHLETLPNLYEPGVTYLPVRWDFSDLEEVVRGALADEERCAAIAAEAWNRASDYLRNKRFIDDMAFLFT